jgi:hypothetical protein
MLNDIEVLDQPDTNYWTATGYRVPDTLHNTVKPGEAGFKLVPVTRNAPRSFITNIRDGGSLPAGSPASVPASPLAAIAVSPASICRSMMARAGGRPSLVLTKANTDFGNGKRRSCCRRAVRTR